MKQGDISKKRQGVARKGKIRRGDAGQQGEARPLLKGWLLEARRSQVSLLGKAKRGRAP